MAAPGIIYPKDYALINLILNYFNNPQFVKLDNLLYLLGE